LKFQDFAFLLFQETFLKINTKVLSTKTFFQSEKTYLSFWEFHIEILRSREHPKYPSPTNTPHFITALNKIRSQALITVVGQVNRKHRAMTGKWEYELRLKPRPSVAV